LSAAIAIGTILLDKYRVDRVLGQGGMGVVLAATHLHLNERVAMKFLLPEVLSNREVVTRFMREAQAAVRLKGEHVARVIDVGTLPWGAPYMVMEYLDGQDLSALIADRGRLPAAEAADHLLQACEGLAEAHAMGIVHRDVKPANFFLTRRPDGSPLLKVLDFGISKSPVTVDGGLTHTQAVMGTPMYMSPEQMRSTRDVDARTDIWALGVVLYECLSGQRPFDAPTFSALCLKAAVDPTPPLTIPLPRGLDVLVYRCLEKEPAARYQSIAELATALAPYAGNQRQAATVVDRVSAMLGTRVPAQPVAPISVAGAHAAPTTLGASAGSTASGAGRSSKGVWVAGGLAVAVAAAVTAFAMTRSGGGATGDEIRPASSQVPVERPPTPDPVPEPAPPDIAPVEAPAVEPAVVDPAPAAIATPVPDPPAAIDKKSKSRKPRSKSKDAPARGEQKAPASRDPLDSRT